MEYFNENYISYSLLGPHDADDIFKVMGSKSGCVCQT